MTITIETESAGAFADANEADLHRVVGLLSATNSYLIVHRDGADDDWAQAALTRRPDATFAGGYIVEHKLPSGGLEQTTAESPERVYELLAAWAFDRPETQRGSEWKLLPETVVDFLGNCAWDEVDGQVRGYFAPLDIAVTGPTAEVARQAMFDALRLITNGSREKALVFSDWAKDHLVERPKSD